MNRGVTDLLHAFLDERNDLKVRRADDETLGIDRGVVVRRRGRLDVLSKGEFARKKRDRFALVLRGIDEKDVFVGNRNVRRLVCVESPSFGDHAAEFVDDNRDSLIDELFLELSELLVQFLSALVIEYFVIALGEFPRSVVVN